ncbi:MAG: DUF1080 domain-containing protein [Sphingobacteriales bacterium]|nr:DUF1080 domain-containing protein [Sphingobacteriales bacterium]
MQKLWLTLLTIILISFNNKSERNKWVSLFDGQSLAGWKVGDHAASFKVEDGAIVVNGDVAHLFYDGDVMQHNFKNFELKIDAMTTPGSNSGIYFHTAYQESGWPKKGYEVQVNNSHTDWRRTGSLWGIQNIKETYVNDNEWFTMHIKVKGKRVTVAINNKQVLDYTEPENVQREESMKERLISSGTFALQGHDPKSKVYFKNIYVKW